MADAILYACESGVLKIHIDLSGVSFFGADGVQILVAAHQRCTREGKLLTATVNDTVRGLLN